MSEAATAATASTHSSSIRRKLRFSQKKLAGEKRPGKKGNRSSKRKHNLWPHTHTQTLTIGKKNPIKIIIKKKKRLEFHEFTPESGVSESQQLGSDGKSVRECVSAAAKWPSVSSPKSGRAKTAIRIQFREKGRKVDDGDSCFNNENNVAKIDKILIQSILTNAFDVKRV